MNLPNFQTLNLMQYKVGILTISDRGAAGEYEDRSGPIATQILHENALGWEVSHQAVVPDEFETIINKLIHWCDEGAHLILTTGGTGFALETSLQKRRSV